MRKRFLFETYKDMNFLIIAKGVTSEWMENFNQVQLKMNELEILGIVSNILVQKFENRILEKQITYNYNGESWESKK